MKIPDAPPPTGDLLARIAGESGGGRTAVAMLTAAMLGCRPVDERGRYLHWDEMRRRAPPRG